MIINENLTMSKYIRHAEGILKYIAEKTSMVFQLENADHYMRCFFRDKTSELFNTRVWYDGEHFKYRCTKDEWDYAFSKKEENYYIINDIKVKDVIERLNLDIRWYRNYLNEKRKESIKKAGEKFEL